MIVMKREMRKLRIRKMERKKMVKVRRNNKQWIHKRKKSEREREDPLMTMINTLRVLLSKTCLEVKVILL
jgi:hypothetical protein